MDAQQQQQQQQGPEQVSAALGAMLRRVQHIRHVKLKDRARRLRSGNPAVRAEARAGK